MNNLLEHVWTGMISRTCLLGVSQVEVSKFYFRPGRFCCPTCSYVPRI